MAIQLPIISKFDSKGVDQAESGLGKLGGVATNIGKVAAAGLAVASAAALAFAGASLQAAAEAEAVSRGMENAVKNSGQFGDATGIKKATEALDIHSTKLAELTGIDDELLNQQKTHWMAVPGLAAMGTDGINRLAEVTANVAAGTGKDVESIGNMFIKVAGDNETAMSKLTRAGVVLSDAQKQTYNDMVAAGDEAGAQTYLIEQLGTAYEGAAAAAANPFDRLNVIFENLKETVGAALLPAIEAIVPLVQEFVTNLTADPAFQEFLVGLSGAFMDLMTALMPLLAPLTDLILALLPPLMELFEAVVPIIVDLVEAFMPLIEGILPPLVDLIKQVLPIFMDLAMKVIEPLIPVIVELVEAFVPLVLEIMPLLTRVIEALIPFVFALMDAFLPIAADLLPVLLDLFIKVGEPMLQLLEKILPPLTEAVKIFGDGLKWMVDNVIKPAISFISDLVGWFEKWLGFDGKSVTVKSTGITYNKNGTPDRDGNPATPMALGGIVMPRPGGMLAQIGEAGKAEAVIPLDRLSSMIGSGGGGATYNISVTAGMGADGAALGEQIVTLIRKYERTSGKVFAAA